MAYQRQTDEVLAGSVNLLAPGDLVPAADAIALHNFRVDGAGSIVSRRGSTELYDGTDLPEPVVHALFRRDEHRYFGTQWGGLELVYRATGASGAPVSLLAFVPPISFAASHGSCFMLSQGSKGRDYGPGLGPFTTWLPDPPDPPTLSQVAGGELVVAQVYGYYITWVLDSGEETNAGYAQLDITTVGQQTMRITHPGGGDTRVTGWHIYRTGNTLPDTYRITRTPIPYGTSFFDDTGAGDYSDLEVTRFGIALEDDNDAPPLANGLIGPYYDSLIAFNSADHPNWFWWSKPNRPASWPGAALDEGNHAPVGEDGEAIIAARIHGRTVRFYKERTIWRLLGNPDPDEGGILVQTNPEIGLIGREAIASFGELDYFQARHGLFVSNGDTARKITAKIEPLFWQEPVAIGGEIVQPLSQNLDDRRANVLEIMDGRLYFSFVNTLAAGTAAPNQTLVYDIASDRWASDSRGFRALYYEGQHGDLMAAPTNYPTGKVWALETVADRSVEGAAFPSDHYRVVYQTGYRNQGVRDRQKTYSDLVIEHSVARSKPNARALTVQAYLNHGEDIENIGSITVSTTGTGDEWVRSIFQIRDEKGITARNCSVRIDGHCEYPVTIRAVELHYYLEPRDAKTFDSDETDCGDPRVKEFEVLQLDIESDAAFTWHLLTDLPGGVMTVRMTDTHDATSGRQSLEIPLTDLPAGRLVRVLCETAGTFRVSGVRLRFKPLGTVRDGSTGEFYESRPIAA